MVQINIKARTIAIAKRKFLRKYPNKRILDVTRTFVTKTTPKHKRIYRVTGLTKGTRRYRKTGLITVPKKGGKR